MNETADAVPAMTKAFHETYERLAPDYGYRTREASAKPWDEVPEQNRKLMMATVRALCVDGIISPGPEVFKR